MSMIFNGTIENFDILFKEAESNIRKNKEEVFIDPDFLSENKEFRKLFSQGSGLKEEDFDLEDTKRERNLVIKFKTELLRKINYIIAIQKNSINIPYYQTVKNEIEAETNKYELEKINDELEKKHDTFMRQDVEKLTNDCKIFLQEIKASSVFSKQKDFGSFINLTEEIRLFLGFIKLYTGLTNLFQEMKIELPQYDVQKLKIAISNIPAPTVAPSIPVNKEKIKIMSYNIMFDSNDLDKTNIIDLINHEKPDILAMQECDWIIGDVDIKLPEFTTNFKGDLKKRNVNSATYFNPQKFQFLNSYDGSDITEKEIKSRGIIGIKLKILSNNNIINIVNFHMNHYTDTTGLDYKDINILRKSLLEVYLKRLNYKPGEEVILCGDSNEFYDEAILKPNGIPINELNKYSSVPYKLEISTGETIDIYFKDAGNGFSCCNEKTRPRNYSHRSDIIGTTYNNFTVFVPQYELDGENENPRKWFSDHRSIISEIEV